MKKKNNDIKVDLIINEIKEFLKTGKEMTYVKSLHYAEKYKEKTYYYYKYVCQNRDRLHNCKGNELNRDEVEDLIIKELEKFY